MNLSLVTQQKFNSLLCDVWRNEDNDIFMTREQIGEALEYSEPNTAIRKIHTRNKEVLDKHSITTKLLASDGKNYSSTIYSLQGIREILRLSNQPRALSFAKSFGMNIVYATKEQETILTIMESFKQLKSIPQYTVMDYRIDLYFPEINLAIECDEYSHNTYCDIDEMRREKNIKSLLGCRFVRFDPDEPNFNIGEVINRIMLEVYRSEEKARILL